MGISKRKRPANHWSRFLIFSLFILPSDTESLPNWWHWHAIKIRAAPFYQMTLECCKWEELPIHWMTGWRIKYSIKVHLKKISGFLEVQQWPNWWRNTEIQPL